jgi:hypothetical protein
MSDIHKTIEAVWKIESSRLASPTGSYDEAKKKE